LQSVKSDIKIYSSFFTLKNQYNKYLILTLINIAGATKVGGKVVLDECEF